MENVVLDDTPSTSRVLGDLLEGDSVTTQITFTSQGLDLFISVSGDRAAVHCDPLHAKGMGCKDRIVHGFYTALPFSRLLGMYLPGPNCVIQSLDLKFKKEVYVGDTLTYRVGVDRIVPAVSAVMLQLSATRHDSEEVCSGVAQCIFPKLR